MNGEHVYVKEFKRMLDIQHSSIFQYFNAKYGASYDTGFWESNYGEEIPIEIARKKALDECVIIKVQQILAKQKGMAKDISYLFFLKQLDEENKKRKEAIQRKEAIYGPAHYEEGAYFNDVFTKMAINLKQILIGHVIVVTETELKDKYDEMKEKSYKKEDKVKVQKIYIAYVDENGAIDEEKNIRLK